MVGKSSIVVTSIGALTPVGASAEDSCAAIQAGISRVTEHAYFECTPDDPEWDEDLPLFSASVPTLDPFMDGYDRFIALAIPSLTEVLEQAKLKRADIANTGLLLALPQADAVTNNMGLAARFIPDICKRTGLTSFKLTRANQLGHTGVFQHINDAIALLESGELEYCIVGGIDSYLLEDRLELLDSAWRIRSERNVDGFIPGEASIMLLLETEAHARSRGAQALSKIIAFADGIEPEPYSSQKTSTGSGLSEAINGILQQTTPDRRFETTYCSLNGESYYAFEWGIQLTRLNKAFEKLTELIHPAENCGDVGAATGGLLIACASKAFQHGYNTGEESLLWTAADNGQRMALCLQQLEC